MHFSNMLVTYVGYYMTGTGKKINKRLKCTEELKWNGQHLENFNIYSTSSSVEDEIEW